MKVNVKVITGIGLIAILLLQIIWAFHTYSFTKKDMMETCNSLLEEAFGREITLRIKEIAKTNDRIEIVSSDESTEEGESTISFILMNEGVAAYGALPSIIMIDSIYNSLLDKNSINTKAVANLVDGDGNIIKSPNMTVSPDGSFQTQRMPITKNHSQNIQATLISPFTPIFNKMGLLFVSTIIMTFFVIYCISYQIHTILYQRKLAKLKKDFIDAMIHDMKSPLASIKMGVQVLKTSKMDNKPEKKSKCIRIVEDEIEHFIALTNKILTIAKLEKTNVALERTHIPLKAMVDDLIEKFTMKATKPVTFTTQIDKAAIVNADAEYLKEVISNLIDNALKYSEKEVDISITLIDSEEDSIIKIRDNGLGIAVKDQVKIFEKFERAAAVKRTPKGGATGFGLGLNYVQQVVAAHGGSVDIDSMEGEYSEFTINLPKITEEYD